MSTDSLSEFDTAPEETPAEAEELAPDPEASEEPAEAEAPEPDPEPEEDRVGEMTERLRRMEDRNDELTRMLLRQQEAAAEPAEPEVPIDPEVEKVVQPIVDKRLKPLEAAIQERSQELQMTKLEEMSPGFKERWPQIQEEFNKLDSDVQVQFDSMAGALALDGMLQKRSEKPTATQESLKRRAHTEGKPVARTEKVKQVSVEDINTMTDAEFATFLESQQRGHGRLGEVDPLLR